MIKDMGMSCNVFVLVVGDSLTLDIIFYDMFDVKDVLYDSFCPQKKQKENLTCFESDARVLLGKLFQHDCIHQG